MNWLYTLPSQMPAKLGFGLSDKGQLGVPEDTVNCGHFTPTSYDIIVGENYENLTINVRLVEDASFSNDDIWCELMMKSDISIMEDIEFNEPTTLRIDPCTMMVFEDGRVEPLSDYINKLTEP